MKSAKKNLLNGNIIFFDGICNYFNGFVRFLIKNDPNEILKFSSIQSSFAKSVFKEKGLKSDLTTIVFLKKGLASEGTLGDTSPWMSPMKLFEYMSSSSPIISTDLPVLREVLDDGNSILVSYDVIEWKKAILKIYNDRKHGEFLAKNAYEDLKSKYTWEKRSAKIFNLINKIK
mgnify:CR=1 FL=1